MDQSLWHVIQEVTSHKSLEEYAAKASISIFSYHISCFSAVRIRWSGSRFDSVV